MLGHVYDGIQIALDLFNQSTVRIVWNLFLAFIPLTLSFYLFRPSAIRNVVWWATLLVFIAFLPNAPYILTDSIHIIELSQDYPTWATILVLIPQYVLFIVAGFEAYAICLTKLDNYLSSFFNPKYIFAIDLIVHGLCVVGIYIGRFERFNSWDLLTRPQAVIQTTIENLLAPDKLLAMAIALLFIWLLSELVKLANSRIMPTEQSTNVL